MADDRYTEHSALVDIGFVTGYLRKEINGDFEPLWYVIERIWDLAIKGRLHESQSADEANRMLIGSLGELKGWLWHTPIPNAISTALDRLTGHYARHCIISEEDVDTLRPNATMTDSLSDHQRQQTLTMGERQSMDPIGKEFATEIGAHHEAVVSFWQDLGVIDESEAINIIAKEAGQPDEAMPEDAASGGGEGAAERAQYALPEYNPIPRSEFEWKPWQKEKLMEMREGGSSWEAIVAVVGRDVQKCRSMYHNIRTKRLESVTNFSVLRHVV